MAYVDPTPNDLRTRYPAFADVPESRIQYWLDDAHRYVDQTWSEPDYAPALIARAAHSMAEAGEAPGAVQLPEGVTKFKSGAFDAEISADAVKLSLTGGLQATRYGRDFLDLLKRRGTGMGVAPAAPFAFLYNAYGWPRW